MQAFLECVLQWIELYGVRFDMYLVRQSLGAHDE